MNEVNDEVVADESVGGQSSSSSSYHSTSAEENEPLLSPSTGTIRRDTGIGTDDSISQDDSHRLSNQSDLGEYS